MRFQWLILAATFVACTNDGSIPKDADWDGASGKDSGEHHVDARDISDNTDILAKDTDTIIDSSADGGRTNCEALGESWCVSLSQRAICSSVGNLQIEDCLSNKVCRDGICVEPGICAPDEIQRCASDSAVKICNAQGDGYEIRSCAESTPTCVNGICVELVCEPNTIFCDGLSVLRCNMDGLESQLLETCAESCSQGRCEVIGDPYCGQTSRAVGCTFLAADLDNYERLCASDFDCGPPDQCIDGRCRLSNANRLPFAIAVANPNANAIEVEIDALQRGDVVQQTIAARDVAIITLPDQTIRDTQVSQRSYLIRTSGSASVYQFNPRDLRNLEIGTIESADASLLLPASSLGLHYRVPSWPGRLLSHDSLRPYMTIVATEDATIISVESPVPTVSGAGVSSLAAGLPRIFNLDQGSVLQLMGDVNSSSAGDLTGAAITSNYPIAVFSGHECANVPLDVDSCDHLEAQVYPMSLWGQEYVGAKFMGLGSEPDVFRVMSAGEPVLLGTVPPIAGVDDVSLGAGEFVEFQSDENFVLTASSPVLLSQFMVGGSHPNRRLQEGDPSLLLPMPTARFRSEYLFIVPPGFTKNFMNLVIPTGTTLHLDGQKISTSQSTASQPSAIIGTNWAVWPVAVTPGVHIVRGSHAFGLNVYGLGNDASYAYVGGPDMR